MEKQFFNFILLVLVLNIALVSKHASAQETNNGAADMSMGQSKKAASSNNGQVAVVSNTNVDLYTGKLQTSLPLYTLTSSDIQIPISLSYTGGGGIRPSDFNTLVGLGWSLNAGGSISRTVRGLPDDATNGYIGNSSTSLTTNNVGALVVATFNNPTNVCSNFNNVNNSKKNNALLDGEPDVFYIQTPFFSARFTMDQNGVPVFQNSSGLTVTHSLYKNSANSSNTGMVVTDDQGNQYYFGADSLSREQTSTMFFGKAYRFVSTWYLNKIILFNSKDVVTFNYTSGTSYSVKSDVLSKDYETGFSNTSTVPPTSPTGQFSGVDARPASFSTVTYDPPKYLSSIITKLGEADFTYTANGNASLNGANPWALTGITIKQMNPIPNAANITIKTFALNYTDVESGINIYSPPVPGEVLVAQYRRLLSGITVAGNTTATSTPLTLFNLKYNQSSAMPDRGLAQNCDYWGFANNLTFVPDAGNGDQSFFTNPDIEMEPSYYTVSTNSLYASILALNEIDDLQGEALKIAYEPNTYYTTSPPVVLGSATNVIVGGMRVSSLQKVLPTGETLTTNYSYNDDNGNSTGQLYNSYYNLVSTYLGTSFDNYLGYGLSNLPTLTFSQTPYQYADDKGVFVGYSAVKVTYPNGGYEIDNFTNFSDYPDGFAALDPFYTITIRHPWEYYIGTMISSFSYKRGLPKSQIVKTQAGNKVTETDYSYATVGPAAVKTEIGLQDNTWYLNSNSTGGAIYGLNVYNSNIENYRLTQTTRYDYDQKTNANSVAVITTYTYLTNGTVPSDNYKLIKSVSTTNSKNQSQIKTFYYACDAVAGIPMIVPADQTAIASLLTNGNSSAVIHQRLNNNNVIRDIHNSYAVQTNINTNISLTSSAEYVTPQSSSTATLVKQQTFNYDVSTGLLLSTNEINGKSTSFQYGYNNSYPLAKIENASSTCVYTAQQTTGSASISPAAIPGSASFTVGYTGTVTITLGFAGSHGANDLTYVSGTLTGPVSANPVFCYGCTGGAYSTSYTIANAPPGNYTFSASVSSTNNASNSPYITCSYPKINSTKTYTNEFFYEGFEQSSNTIGAAHTGYMYYSGNYTVPFTPPNSRAYIIQYWNLAAGVWNFNEKPYTANMLLTGPVDDVRVFPSDALMSTAVFNPLIGKTSATDPAGHSEFYQYDGLGRQTVILDNDLNIVRAFDYKYQQSVVPPVEYTVTLGNQTTYPAGITTVTIDGIANSIPAPGVNTTLNIGVTAGSHTIKLAAGPSSYYTINGTAYSAQTLTYTVTGNVTINYITTPAYTVTLANQSTYPANIVNATIDGTVYNFPGPGLSTLLSSTLTPGNHTIKLSAGPSSCYTINGVNYTSAQTNPAIMYPISGNLTINYLNSCPVTVTSASCNLTSDATNTTVCSCHGCQYTATVYYSGTSAGVGTQLYTDAALTQKVTGKTWFMEYSTNLSWPISSTGVITGSSTLCQ